jgi:hypothetical protein
LELVKDYDIGINYHPGKANVVADTLSHRSRASQLVEDSMPFELCEEFNKLNLGIVTNTEATEMEVGSNLLQKIRKGQVEDEMIQEIKRNIKEEKSPGFLEDEEGVLWYKGRIWVPNIKELKDKILCEAHESAYSIHLGGNKMHHDLKATSWWYKMRRDIAEYLLAVIKCIYLLPTYLHFSQDIEDRCLLLMSSTSFVDLPFQEHWMMEKYHMD